MKGLAILSLFTVASVAANTGGPKFSPEYPPRENYPRRYSPKFYFDSLVPETETPQKDEPQETHRPTSVIDVLSDHLNKVRSGLGTIVPGEGFVQTSGVGSKTQEDDGILVVPGVKKCFNCRSWYDAFSQVFGPSFRKHISSHDTNFINNLPPNYSNSTSNTRTNDGSTTVVNQTIHKQTGKNFHSFFHIKVIHTFANGSQEEKEFDQEGDPFGVDKADDEVELPNYEPSSYSLGRTFNRLHGLSKRSLSAVPRGNKGIVFPPAHINRFPHSMANNNDFVPAGGVDKENKSRSWVYKSMGGKSYLYGISHNDKGKKDTGKKKLFHLTRDAKPFGAPKPFDLSRDTRVNPDGTGNQQGSVLAEPAAEVFNLTLVIKEAESRANSE